MKNSLILILFCVTLQAQTNYFGGNEPFKGDEVIQVIEAPKKEFEIYTFENNIRQPMPQFRVRDNVIIPLKNGIEQPQKRIEINETEQNRTNRLEYIQRTVSERRAKSRF